MSKQNVFGGDERGPTIVCDKKAAAYLPGLKIVPVGP
jgi:hypothetical protein